MCAFVEFGAKRCLRTRSALLGSGLGSVWGRGLQEWSQELGLHRGAADARGYGEQGEPRGEGGEFCFVSESYLLAMLLG